MAVFKKEYGLLVPQHFTTFKQCGDWYFWIHIVRNGDLFISSKLLNYYRNVEQSLTTGFYATGYNFLEELQMFSLLKKEQRENIFFINNSIFNRYNSFMRRKDKLTKQEQSAVFNAFNDLFGGRVSFHFFLLKQEQSGDDR